MAIFTFPTAPVTGQTYLAPNGVTYTWDSEKWVGSGAAAGLSGDWLDKTPLPSNEQVIVPGQATDRALRIKALPGQSGNLLEFIDAASVPLAVFDEAGRLGLGTSNPTFPLEVIGDISLTGALRANGSAGLPGQHLVTDGIKAYWENDKQWTLDSVLAAGNISSRAMTVGNMNIQGNLTVTGTQTIVNTEVIKLADNIITLNSNYSGNTPNENAGLEVNRGSLAAKYFFWDETLDKWSIGTETFSAGLFQGNLVGNVTGTVSSLANHTTTDVAEGTNLYFTNTRARAALSTTGDLAYNAATGVMTYSTPVRSVNGKLGHVILTTDDVPEGPNNKYVSDATLLTFFQRRSINDLSDVNTDGVANGDILYWDAASASFKTIPGDFEDDFISDLVFTNSDGLLTATRFDGTVLTTSMDGRYLHLTGGTLTGPINAPTGNFDVVNANTDLNAFGNTNLHGDLMAWGNAVFQDDLRVWGTLSANIVDIQLSQLNDVQDINATNNQVLTWNSTTVQWEPKTPVLAVSSAFDSTNGVLTTTNNDGTTVTADLDGRYLELANGGTVSGPTVFSGSLQSLITPATPDDVTNKAYVDGLIANSEVFTSNATFDITTGILTQTRNDLSTYNVDLDGRYVLEPAGAVTGQVLTWDGAGWISANVAAKLDDLLDVNVTGAVTGDLLKYDAGTQTWGLISINNVTPDTYVLTATVDSTATMTMNHNTGTTVVVNMAPGLDARYINTSGDTMTGPLLLNGAPTAPTEATTKAYVDALVANSEIGIASFGFSAAGDGNLMITETNGNTHIVDLDGRYLELVAGGTVSGTTIFSGRVQTPTAPIIANDLTNKFYVDNLVANSEISINAISFSTAGGGLTIQDNKGSNYTVDLDGRYLETAGGGTVNGPVVFNSTIQTASAPLLGNDITNKTYVDAKVANSEVTISGFTFSNVDGNLVVTETNGSVHAVDLDGRYLGLVDGGVVLGSTTFSGGLKSTVAPVGVTDVANKAYVDALVANSEITVNAVSFSIATGNLIIQDTKGVNFAVDLDGRYVQTVNGIVPDAAGNVPLSLTATSTGTFAAMPASANNGSLYIVSGDTANNNGETYIFNAGAWVRIVSFDQAEGDARYINVSGDAMVGALTLAADPTTALQAATKNYVDTLVANSEVYTNTAIFDIANGVITQTRNNGTTYTVDLDGRYLELVNGGTVTGNTIFANNVEVQGTLIANNTTLVLNDLADVNAVAPANGNVLTWNAATNQWISSQSGLIIVSPTAPVSPLIGTAWYDSDAAITTSGRTFVWDGTQWIDLAPAGVAGQTWTMATTGAASSSANITIPVNTTYKEFNITIDSFVLFDTVSINGGIDIVGNATDGTTEIIDSFVVPTASYPINTSTHFTAYVNGGTSAPTTYLAGKFKKTLTSIVIKPRNAGDNIVSGTFTVWVK